MSMEAIRWAYLQACGDAKATLCCLAWHAGRGNWITTVGIKTIAAETEQGKRTVVRHLEDLTALKLIDRQRRARATHGKVVRLRDRIRLNPPLDATMAPSESATMAPSEKAAKCHRVKRKVPPCQAQGATMAPCYIDNPVLEPSAGTQSESPTLAQEAEPGLAEIRRADERLRQDPAFIRIADYFGASAQNEKPKKRKTAMPEGWPGPMLECEAENFWRAKDRDDLAAGAAEIAEAARQWHRAQDSRFADWDARWRGWYRRQLALQPPPKPNGARSHQKMTAQEIVAKALRAADGDGDDDGD